jgi:putative peptide maturation dehydrogenase
MPRYRRSRYLFLYCDDRPLLDIPALLRGRAVLTPLRQILAISILTATELPISHAELDVLLTLPADEWADRHGDESDLLDGLARRGVVLSEEDNDRFRELRRREQALCAGKWNIYAAFYHYLTKWCDVDVPRPHGPLEPDAPNAGLTEAFIRAAGPPPPHFSDVSDAALTVTDLPLVERRGGLWETLTRRRTTRDFAPEPLTLAELSLVLRYTFGCHGSSEVATELTVLRKTSPSGGAMHPTEVYVLARNVDDLELGIYHYGVERHQLELLRRLTPDESNTLAVEVSAGQAFVRDAAALFLITTRFYRNYWKYRHHRRAYAVLLMDAAHLAQTFYLVCTELGVGVFVTAAVNGANIEKELGLDPFAEGALALWGCGRPAAAAPTDFDRYVPRAH